MINWSIKTSVLTAIIIISGSLSVYSVYTASEGLVAGSALYQSWAIVFTILIAIWTIEDMKEKGENPTLGHGAAAFFFWPLFLLWHLVKTRGAEGIVVYIGFWGLYVLANFLSMAMYLT